MKTEQIKTSKRERILHTVLFEIIAISLMASFVILFTNESLVMLTGFGIGMSLLAMTWNYVYNLMFDKRFGTDKINRTWKIRAGHAFFFELGLMLVSIPILMNILEKSFVDVFIINLWINIFFLVYAISYNFIFDNIKYKYFTNKQILV